MVAPRGSVGGEGWVDVSLAGDVDPYRCEGCLAAGDACPFHQGFADGWDACAAFVAGVVSRG